MPREHYDALLHHLDEQLLEMGEMVAKAVSGAVDALARHDVAAEQRLIEADNDIDAFRHEVEREALLLIATQQPLARDLRALAAILTIATELERIGDYAEGIAKLGLRMAAEPRVPISSALIARMTEITTRLLHDVLVAFRQRDLSLAAQAWKADDEVDELYEEAFATILNEMIADPAKIRLGTYFLWVAHNIERMADRVTNIAEQVAFIVSGDVAAFREELRSHNVPGMQD